MELQWPLILFTTFISASAGLFAAQGCYALAGEGRKAQLPALITSVVIMAIGGIAVFSTSRTPTGCSTGSAISPAVSRKSSSPLSQRLW